MMKHRFFLMAFMLIVGISAMKAQKQYQVYGVGFYNQENLFDTLHDVGKNDYEYLPDGTNKWGTLKFTHKLHNMARALADLGTDQLPGVGCAIVGLSEVENMNALQALVDQPELKARGYKIAHIEGEDRRGVDCALMYNPSLFKLRDMKLVPYVQELEQDSAYKTRGFLVVSGSLAGEHVTAIVCHWPSRASTSFYRESGGRQVRVVKDSLLRGDPNCKIFVMGDMNDDPHDKSMSRELGALRNMEDVKEGDMYNPWWKILDNGTGTLFYDGRWNLFDQIVMTPNLLSVGKEKDFSKLKYWKAQVFRRDYLLQQEGSYKGQPKRTHAGGVWLDGYSDHLPVVLYVVKERDAVLADMQKLAEEEKAAEALRIEQIKAALDVPVDGVLPIDSLAVGSVPPDAELAPAKVTPEKVETVKSAIDIMTGTPGMKPEE